MCSSAAASLIASHYRTFASHGRLRRYDTRIATDGSRAARIRRGLLLAALYAAFLGALLILDRANLVPSPYRVAPGGGALVIYSVIALAGIATALAPPAYRRRILLAAGTLAVVLALHAWALALFGYVALVLALARWRWPIIPRFAIALAAWLVVPALRVRVLSGLAQAQTILLAELWVGMLYAALYLIVERARALPGETSSLADDAFYLLAPPRLVMPFFQPISPRELIAAERPRYPWRLIRRAAWLAGYALLVAVAAHELDRIAKHVPHAPALVIKFAAYYARSANAIFVAMAAFRLSGYAVGSGFRLPFLSRSFADFFRRYNHYVRDAVVSLFYMPALGHLRTRLPRRAASIAAAYFGIFIGSLALQDLLIPAGISLRPLHTIHMLLRPNRIFGMLLMWSLIVLPNAGIMPRRRPLQPRWRIALQIVLVDAIYVAMWYLRLR